VCPVRLLRCTGLFVSNHQSRSVMSFLIGFLFGTVLLLLIRHFAVSR
jgi:hypothetical protein